MAECTDCSTRIGGMRGKVSKGGRCLDCFDKFVSQRRQEIEAEKREAKAKQAEIDRQINTVLLTTEVASEMQIKERIEIITAECAFGMNIFKDLFAGVRDVVGGRSKAVQENMREARRTALFELKREAYEVGANAVVGVDLDYVELSSSGSMVLLVASGTAVRIDTP